MSTWDPGVVEVRNRANLVSGVLLMALTGVLALGDPNLSLGAEKGWDSLDLEFLGLKLLFIAAALCAGRAFVVPWVEISAEGVRVCNPLRTYVIPWRCVGGLDLSERWPRMDTPGRRVALVGAERSLWMKVKGSKDRVTTLLRYGLKDERARRLREGIEEPATGVTVTWTRIRVFEWCYLAISLSVLAVFVARAVGLG